MPQGGQDCCGWLRRPAPWNRLPAAGCRRLVRHLRDGSTHAFDVLYAALGLQPRAHLATAPGARQDEIGALLIDADCRTDVPGLYAAGDVVTVLDPIAVATGQGAIAATAIHNDLDAAERRS